LAQFNLISSASKSDKALEIIDRIEEVLNEIEQPELKESSEVLSYSMILNNLEVKLPSAMIVRMLSRFMDLAEENLGLKEIKKSFEEGREGEDLPRIGQNQPAQVLFSYMGVRLQGLDDLHELFSSLDELPSSKRDQLLGALDSDIEFASLLINRAWWKELEDGALDEEKALQVLDFALTKSREWGVPELTKTCLVAISVIYDEYGESTEHALEVLDDADKEFPDDAALINQRAKVLFHAKRDSEALPIAYKAIESPALSRIDFLFSCRNIGIAVAKLDDWSEAERVFLLAADKAFNSDLQLNMRIGFMSDAAFSLWKQKKCAESLLRFADVLDLLGAVSPTENIHARYLHATVRHSIVWVHSDALGDVIPNLAEPLPGMCSNQEPHEGFEDLQIIDLSASWKMLEITEKVLGLEIGINERAAASTGGKTPQVVEGYARAQAFEAIFKNKSFESLVPALIGMREAVDFSKGLKEGEEDSFSMDSIPKLPNGYWSNHENIGVACHYFLVASVICSADNHSLPLPIERWREDLTKEDALVEGIDQFFNVLNGSKPNETLYQHAAAAIFELRRGAVSPRNLWLFSFKLLNAFVNGGNWVEDSLERFLVPRWSYAIHNQKFSFKTPALAFPAIERVCLHRSCRGMAKIATIVDVASPYVDMHLSPEAKKMIEDIINSSGDAILN
ncbi:MAG: hypothetical protein RQ867_09725, partial [Mariprofundaceae bacterium]|nr:hypothetical protein [Mariprofundaceae bacterium]